LIDRFNDKESLLFARKSIKSINKQISSSLLKIKHHFIHFSFSNHQASSFIQSFFKQISSCLVVHLLKSVLKNFKIISFQLLMLIHVTKRVDIE